ncbi:MAG: hypothetical protein F8N39_08430 [Clostridiaceae bacterium]|nr:hypothetical protein [Clostridiaceae bacterium]
MASNTPNLNLYKKDPTIDGNDTFNIKTMLNDNWDKIDAAVTAKVDKVDFSSHLADDTKHVSKDGKLQTGLNSEKINGKIATATPLTTEKNDLIGMINETFTNANNGKTSLANVIGSPTVASETFSQISTDVQNRKNELASNLSAKGVSALSSEGLQSLINKISSISTGKFASGTTTSSMSTQQFPVINGGIYNWYSVTINSLNFKPDIIIVKSPSGLNSDIAMFDNLVSEYYKPSIKVARYSFDVGMLNSQQTFTFKGDAGPAYINSTGFNFPALMQNMAYNWCAIKLG